MERVNRVNSGKELVRQSDAADVGHDRDLLRTQPELSKRLIQSPQDVRMAAAGALREGFGAVEKRRHASTALRIFSGGIISPIPFTRTTSSPSSLFFSSPA